MKLPPGATVWREMGGPLAWSQSEHFDAALLHAAQIANWQRTENGTKGTNRPEPIEPPPLATEKRQKEDAIAKRARAFRAAQALRKTTTE